MGQGDILAFLEAHPDKWFTGAEIAQSVGVAVGSVTIPLRQLRRTPYVHARMQPLGPGHNMTYIYRYGG